MGHREVIQELYRGCYRRLVLQLHPVTGNLSDAQEVVQEAFVRLLAKPSRVASLDNPEAWLRRVAVNLARSKLRRAKILRRLLLRAEPRPAEEVGAKAEHVALMEALRQLPEGQRLALGLHYLADLPVRQVADALSVSEGTVKSRLSRGRAALAELLDETVIEITNPRWREDEYV